MFRFLGLISVALILNCASGELKPFPISHRVHSEYNLALDAIFSMGLRLEALLSKSNTSNKNFLISPISATTLIAELMLGASGETLEQLYELISLPSARDATNATTPMSYSELHSQLSRLLVKLNEKKIDDQFKLESTNVLFHDRNELLRDDFLARLHRYDAHVFPMDFANDPKGAETFMDGWANKSTHGLIRKFLPHPPSSDTSAIFGNILYFRADWDVPFSYELIKRGEFRVSDKETVNVTYMFGEMESIPYYESKELECKMIALPYKNNQLSMYIILPTSRVYDIKDFVRKLKLKDVTYMLRNLKSRKVSVILPKISITSTVELLKPLQKYAAFKKAQRQNTTGTSSSHSLDEIERRIKMYERFDESENVDIYLTDASKLHPLRVSNIVQQVKMIIDEKGTEAAAVTAGLLDYIADSKSFYVKQPFTFFIRHEETTATLFWGTIVDPTADGH